MYPTKGNNTLPSRPHFGQSDDVCLLLLPTYIQLINCFSDSLTLLKCGQMKLQQIYKTVLSAQTGTCSEMPHQYWGMYIISDIVHQQMRWWCGGHIDSKIISQPESLDEWRSKGSNQSQKSCLSVRRQGNIQYCQSETKVGIKETSAETEERPQHQQHRSSVADNPEEPCWEWIWVKLLGLMTSSWHMFFLHDQGCYHWHF